MPPPANKKWQFPSRSILPLEKLVCQVFEANPSSKQKFIKTLGYKNPDKGFRWFYRCLRTGQEHRDILKQLPGFLGIDENVYALALKATRDLLSQQSRISELESKLSRQYHDNQARLSFRPYLYVQASSPRPICSITIYALMNLGRARYLSVPEDLQSLSRKDQINRLGIIIRKHYHQQHGTCPGMGDITGYNYRNTYDSYYLFDLAGHFVKEFSGCFDEPKAEATIQGRAMAMIIG